MRRLALLAICLLAGCDDRQPAAGNSTAAIQMSSTTLPAKMNKYPYLAADGGPHMLLPLDVSASWSGASSPGAVLNPKSDYGRACAATAQLHIAKVGVGKGSALVFSDPPMTSWGRSVDGLTEVYYLASWGGNDLDLVIDNATAALPTASLIDSGIVIAFEKPDAYLLFAGDTPASTAYGVHTVAIAPGKYRVLVGTYVARRDSVTIYRLQPVKI